MTADPPVKPRTRKARRTSRCPACGSWLRPGTRIARIDRRGWLCLPCAIAARLTGTSTEEKLPPVTARSDDAGPGAP